MRHNQHVRQPSGDVVSLHVYCVVRQAMVQPLTTAETLFRSAIDEVQLRPTGCPALHLTKLVTIVETVIYTQLLSFQPTHKDTPRILAGTPSIQLKLLCITVFSPVELHTH